MLKATFAILICIAITVSLFTVQAEYAPKWHTSLIDSRGSHGSLALDSTGTPHVVFSSYTIETIDYFDFAEPFLQYVVWNGTSWVIQPFDGSGYRARLALDSGDNPHIVYVSEVSRNSGTNAIKYAVLKDGNWTIQTIDSDVSLQFSMALDSTGKPHILYTTHNYVKYATFNGSNWTAETIDTIKKSFDRDDGMSIALDSNDLPHAIYLEDTDDNSYDNYNIIYAQLSGSRWQTQTVINNAYDIGNLVLTANGQPAFCYQKSPSGNPAYANWDGNAWSSRLIFLDADNQGRPFLHLDANGFPEVYDFVTYNQNSPNNGLMYAHWTGTNWNIKNLGNFTQNSNSQIINDIKFDFNGNLILMADGGYTETIRGAHLTGDLTYAALDSLPDAVEGNLPLIPFAIVATALIIAVIVIGIMRKSKKQQTLRKVK